MKKSRRQKGRATDPSARDGQHRIRRDFQIYDRRCCTQKFQSTQILLAAALFATFAASGAAQEQETQENRQLTPQQVESAIAQLEKHIETRERRVAELTSDMLAYDERSENRVNGIVNSLESITDSLESRTRVAETKDDVMNALKTCMQHYDSRRRTLKAETMERNPRITREELFNDIGRFDAKIEERLDQIIELTNSLQLHQDYSKWTLKYDDYGWDSDGYYRSRNPRYYHNRREATRTEQNREDLLADLKANIEGLDRRNRDIQEKLAKDITPKYRQMLLAELEANQNLIVKRDEQIGELAFSSQPVTRAIGRDQALNVEDLVEDMAEDLERDCDAIWRVYLEINQERQALKALHEQRVYYQGLRIGKSEPE